MMMQNMQIIYICITETQCDINKNSMQHIMAKLLENIHTQDFIPVHILKYKKLSMQLSSRSIRVE